MGTFYGRIFFYDHLNKKDSELILVVKSFFILISSSATFELKVFGGGLTTQKRRSEKFTVKGEVRRSF